MPSQNGPVVTILNKIISVYAICLLIMGTILNLTSIFICRRKRLKNTSTFIILSFFFFFNSTSLYTWNLDIFLTIFEGIGKHKNLSTLEADLNSQNIIESQNIVTCKIFTFMQYFSLQAISWLLTYLTIDQNLKIYFPILIIPNKLVYTICGLIITALFIINFHILLFVGVYKTIDGSDEYHFQCYETYTYNFYPMWDQVHTFLYCFVPFFLMIVSNILLAWKLVLSRRSFSSVSKTSLRKKKNISIFCIAFSFTFIICTIPEKICYGFFYERLNKSSGKWYGLTVLRLSDELNFTFIGFNFVFQLALNRLYRTEFFKLVLIFSQYLRTKRFFS